MPGARQKGRFPKKRISKLEMTAVAIVATITERKSIPVSDRMAGATITMYAIVAKDVSPAISSVRIEDFLSSSLKNLYKSDPHSEVASGYEGDSWKLVTSKKSLLYEKNLFKVPLSSLSMVFSNSCCSSLG